MGGFCQSIVPQRVVFCSSSHFSLSPGAEESVRLDKASAISAPARFSIHLTESSSCEGEIGSILVDSIISTEENLSKSRELHWHLHQERCVSDKVGLCFTYYIPISCDQNPCRVTENDSETEHAKGRQAIEFSICTMQCSKKTWQCLSVLNLPQGKHYFFWHKVTFCVVQPLLCPHFPIKEKQLPGCSTLLPLICSMCLLLHLSKTT